MSSSGTRSRFAHQLSAALRDAYIDAWINFFADFAWQFNPERAKVEKSQRRDMLDGEMIGSGGGGNFDGAGTGGQD